ncbi:xylulokinase [Zafaria sp. J156]|uniref:xylulokinase n=1 Tax=Zafaria sp. J156 TaxID=3116490 RepID=UPI002E7687CB|nr:xylulokinase [Zafaria sp. J156]MEE1621752.1 xylulokinase [Zafaria sp. J156]
MRDAVVGIDSSTQSCKVLVVDPATGEVLRSASTAHPDGSRIDPRVWVTALRKAWAEAAPGSTERIVGVGLAAQQHGMVALDAHDEPVHDALLWNDTLSAEAARRMVAERGGRFWAEAVGSVPVASYTLTKLAWLAEHRPEDAARTVRVVLPHDYLNHALTGEYFTDRSDASGTAYYSPRTGYLEDVLREYFGRVPELPEVLAPDGVGGRLLPEWGAGPAPVSAGAGDNAAAALGLGMRPGEVAVSIGTSGTVFRPVTQIPTPDASGAVAGFADAEGGYLPLIAVINAARVMASTAGLLGVGLPEFDALASSGASDAGGLLMLPYFDGERTPNLPDATGSLVGVSRSSFSRENMARASVLAVLNSLADAADALSAVSGPAERYLLIGGGSKSRSLGAAAPELFGAPVDVPVAGEYVALGAARQAAWAASGELPAWERRMAASYEPSAREAGTASESWGAAVRRNYAQERRRLYGS